METMSLNEYNNRPKPPKKQLVISPRIGLAVLSVALLVASFLSGMAYQKGKTKTSTTTQTATTAQRASGQFGGRTGFGGGFQRGDRAIGTVSAVSSSSITIATRQGTSSTYAITSSTTVTNSGSSASVSDIQTGDTVFITLDSSNTTDASSIALNPSFGGAMGGGSPTDGTSDNSGSSTDSGASST